MFKKYGGQKYKYTIRKGGSHGGGFNVGAGLAGVKALIDSVLSLRGRFREYLPIVKIIAAALLVGFIIMLGVDYYNVRQLAEYQPNVSTKIYDKNGILMSELFHQKRDVVPLNKIPKNLVNAFIAVEDNDFYDHWGINPKGIIRAFFINIASGRVRQGGSTITQQLSKILLTNQKRSLFRKVKEACISLMIEATYSKDKIMELYLNQIFLGHGANGVETAAKFYFNKHVDELNLAECSLLATLPSSPNNYSPIKYPERSMRLHRQALAKMVDMGFATRTEAEKAYLEFWPQYLQYINDLPPSISAASERVDRTPWFTEYIRRRLVEKYGEDAVFERGLSVYTTCDVKKQEAAEKVMRERLKKQSSQSFDLSFKKDDDVIENVIPTVELFSLLYGIDPIPSKTTLLQKKVNNYFQDQILDQFDGLSFIAGTDPVNEFMFQYRQEFLQDKEFQNVEGAIITINHNNGYIEAMVGGSAFTSINQLNRAMQARRQSGSAIKPLLYSAAFDTRKFTPASTVLDSPVVYLDSEGGDWMPENYDEDYLGLVRLRYALQRSLNTVSIRIAEKIGIGTVLDYYARLLHFTDVEKKNRIRRDMSIALGSVEVSPYELARAYGIIARGGSDFNAFAIRKITDMKGKVLDNTEEDMKAQAAKNMRQIIKPETAQLMISMLQSVMSGGTGLSASIGRSAGGKTGTTNNWKDAWFVGFTPDVTTCVWVGYDRLGMSLGAGQTGSVVAAPIWGEYMRHAVEGEPAHDFPHYAGLEEADVCERSGMLMSTSCAESIKEVFAPGTVPTDICNVCQEGDAKMTSDMRRKGPKDNIVKKQKEDIYNKIKKPGKPADTVGNDLLD
jgi:penicillin-binding protein 1A